MADSIVIISNASPVKFHEKGYVNPIPYNTRYFEDHAYEDTDMDFVDPVPFAAPIEKSDIMPLQLLANFDGPFNLRLIDPCGIQVQSFLYAYVASSVEASGLKVFQVTPAFDDFISGNGYYFELDIGNPITKTLTSEKLNIQDNHPRSFLMQYKHRSNDYDIVFETGIEFAARIPGGLTEYDPNLSGVVYIDQIMDAVLLDAKSFDRATLLVGDYGGVPDYLIQKVRDIFKCSQVLIDGKQFVSDSGAAKFDAKRNEAYPMTGWGIVVRRAKSQISKRFISTAEEGDIVTTVVYNISSQGFGAISNPASDNIIQIESID